ncbi:hypothetical protein [Collimonas sp. OK607]|nr:hypothetical protein [Collimonas sp. OK607]
MDFDWNTGELANVVSADRPGRINTAVNSQQRLRLVTYCKRLLSAVCTT